MESKIQIFKLSRQTEPEACLFKCLICDSHNKSRILDIEENMKYSQVYDNTTRTACAT